jgi:glycosyltransferase involved in cell wall biosynthesis
VRTTTVALYHQIADDVWHQEYSHLIATLGRHVIEPRWLRRMRTARVVAVSRSTQTDLARHRVECIAVAAPGVDDVSSSPREGLSGAPHLVFMGRLVAAKRPLEALAAFEALRMSIPDATLDVVGTGYLEAELRHRADSNVTVHGYVSEDEKRTLLARAHVLLMPGTREGWGIVVMEAAQHGVPAIAYDVPGLRDAVVDGHSGVLVQPTYASLADAAASLLGSPQRWLELSRGAQDRAAQFGWETSARILLEAALNGSRPSSSDRQSAA